MPSNNCSDDLIKHDKNMFLSSSHHNGFFAPSPPKSKNFQTSKQTFLNQICAVLPSYELTTTMMALIFEKKFVNYCSNSIKLKPTLHSRFYLSGTCCDNMVDGCCSV